MSVLIQISHIKKEALKHTTEIEKPCKGLASQVSMTISIIY